MIVATWHGKTLAKSDHTVVVEGNHYFPLASVDKQYLAPSDHHTVCPWKGTASYYHVVVDGEMNPNAAWYYPKAMAAAKQIEGYIAFWHGVDVKKASPAETPARR